MSWTFHCVMAGARHFAGRPPPSQALAHRPEVGLMRDMKRDLSPFLRSMAPSTVARPFRGTDAP